MTSRLPTDAEIDAVIHEHGMPVRLAVGDAPTVLVGWLPQRVHGHAGHAMADLLREAADVMDRAAREDDQ